MRAERDIESLIEEALKIAVKKELELERERK
jgi:hypothetical protein